MIPSCTQQLNNVKIMNTVASSSLQIAKRKKDAWALRSVLISSTLNQWRKYASITGYKIGREYPEVAGSRDGFDDNCIFPVESDVQVLVLAVENKLISVCKLCAENPRKIK